MGTGKSQRMGTRRSERIAEAQRRRASMEERLPPEIWEKIMEKLDRETLCTARQVSKTFCAAASANISSLTIEPHLQFEPMDDLMDDFMDDPMARPCSEDEDEDISLERFPRLRLVAVHHRGNDFSLSKLDPELRAEITHLTVRDHADNDRLQFSDLPRMPKLRELDVFADFHLDEPVMLHHLTSLEVLRIGYCTLRVAWTMTTTLTRLTSLTIGLVTEHDDWIGATEWRDQWHEHEDFSWLQRATNLSSLQALHIGVSPEALPLLGNLTGLTGLTWLGGFDETEDSTEDDFSIAPLSSLTRLRSLDIYPYITEEDVDIARSLVSLTELRVRGQLVCLD